MAMIGRNAAVAEVGPRRRELHGFLAYASWLGVHAWLLSGFRARVERARLVDLGLRRRARGRRPTSTGRTRREIDWDE